MTLESRLKRLEASVRACPQVVFVMTCQTCGTKYPFTWPFLEEHMKDCRQHPPMPEISPDALTFTIRF